MNALVVIPEYALTLDDIGDINDIAPVGPTNRGLLALVMSMRKISQYVIIQRSFSSHHVVSMAYIFHAIITS